MTPELVDQTVILRARLQNKRESGNKRTFLELRQKTHTIQAIISVEEGAISKQMVKFVNGISPESLVLVEAIVASPLDLVKSCSVQNVELQIQKIHVVSEAARLPFTLEDASRSELDFEKDPQLARVNIDTRLNNRVIDLRVCYCSNALDCYQPSNIQTSRCHRETI